jgi:hypothetical protein
MGHKIKHTGALHKEGGCSIERLENTHVASYSSQVVWTLEKDRADIAAEYERFKQVCVCRVYDWLSECVYVCVICYLHLHVP